MSISNPKEHGNNCIKCGSKITKYNNASNDAGSAEVAYCDSCDGYPCSGECCGYGPFIVSSNPLRTSINCPGCGSHAALVQIKDGWW